MEQIITRDLKPIALIIGVYQPNKAASDILRVAVDSLIRFSHPNSCIWIIDLDSPLHADFVTPNEYPGVNFIISDDEPFLTTQERVALRQKGYKIERHGSEAAGLTLELAPTAFEKINYNPEFIMTLQMDVLATSPTWLEEILKHFTPETIAVGVRGQPCYDKSTFILHSLGTCWRYRPFMDLKLSFMPDFPAFDVSEKAVVQANNAGWDIVALPNTYSNPELIGLVKEPYKTIYSDRTLDNQGNVIFMHLGRGVAKSVTGETPEGKTSPEQWISFARKLLAADVPNGLQFG